MNTTRTKTHGTIAEFMLARQAAASNLEQQEAFAVEFYFISLQLVKDNRFSIGSEQAFPVMDTAGIDMAEFLAWSFKYWTWIAGLYDFEREALATAEVMWE